MTKHKQHENNHWGVLAGLLVVGLNLSVPCRAQSPSVHGSGAANYVPLWLDPSTLGASNIYRSGSGNLGVGTTTPGAALDVNGAINATTSFNLGGFPFAFGSSTLFNVGLGTGALQGNTTGAHNTALGYQALAANATGVTSTAVGSFAAYLNTGSGNTAVGDGALYGYDATGPVNGSLNTAVGAQALFRNTTGANNTAVGWFALQSNTTGAQNAASGHGAMAINTTGTGNSAHGYLALYNNTTGQENSAHGYLALYNNTTGQGNSAHGAWALWGNRTGSDNAAIGRFAMSNNDAGNLNTALGAFAGPDSGSSNLTNATAIGAYATVRQSNTMVLGSPGVRVGIGTSTPSNVFTVAQGAGVAISDGWTTYSSRRWKTNIQTLQGALGKVEQLRGVSYEVMANGKHEVGLIAEEVGAVVPELVSWDQNGQDAQGVDYSRLTALLIEATKQQQALIRGQQKQIKDQQAQIADLASQIKTIRVSLASSSQVGLDVRVKTELNHR